MSRLDLTINLIVKTSRVLSFSSYMIKAPWSVLKWFSVELHSNSRFTEWYSTGMAQTVCLLWTGPNRNKMVPTNKRAPQTVLFTADRSEPK
jgi:hypothetical protein